MQRPVAVFDSGVGGLCLLKKVKRYLPCENFLYFADNKNVPYGNKRQSEIEELMKNNMQTILKHNPKAVLIGCNTVTAICLQGLKNDYPNVFFAGQLSGVEGYMESAASGLMAGINLARRLKGEETVILPVDTMIGALSRYISDESVKNFQPMGANFGVLPPLPEKIRDKQERYMMLAQRGMESLKKAKV